MRRQGKIPAPASHEIAKPSWNEAPGWRHRNHNRGPGGRIIPSKNGEWKIFLPVESDGPPGFLAVFFKTGKATKLMMDQSAMEWEKKVVSGEPSPTDCQE